MKNQNQDKNQTAINKTSSHQDYPDLLAGCAPRFGAGLLILLFVGGLIIF